jgi:ABC-2 type transport system ATP-binding protein
VSGGRPRIEAVGLAKSFDGKRAVDGVSFAIPPGEIFSLLGPNGSGKTTTVRLLNGILGPDAGEALVDGIRAADDPPAVHARCGV